MGEKREVTSQDRFQRPHLGTSAGPQDLRVQQFRRPQRAPKLPQGTAPGETWLLRACVWQQGQEQRGLEQGWETGCGGGWLTGSAESLQSRDYISMGRRTGRGSLRDTVERRFPVHGHCEGERESKEGELGTERARKNPSSERPPFSYTHPWRTPTPCQRLNPSRLARHNNMSLNVYGHLSVTKYSCQGQYLLHDPPFLEPIPTLQELGHKVGSCLGLLDSVSLHDPAFLVQA